MAWYYKDAVALFLDLAGGERDGRLDAGEHAFAFVADPGYPSWGKWWRHGTASAGNVESPAPPETRLAVRIVDDTGYDLEAAIPMSALSEHTQGWTPPFPGRTVRFMVYITDPDGGPEPWGGALTYAGAGGHDGEPWGRLRFSAASTVGAPYEE